jgi:hypothetical protein
MIALEQYGYLGAAWISSKTTSRKQAAVQSDCCFGEHNWSQRHQSVEARLHRYYTPATGKWVLK